VDAYGIPQNPEILKSLDPGLDQEAIKAVMQYRFKPAIRNGQPVPVHITIAITFNLR
jgi:TonB family protein